VNYPNLNGLHYKPAGPDGQSKNDSC